MIAIFFLSLIKSEITTGFVIENGKQLLELRLDQNFVDIKRSFLLVKQKDTGDFLQIRKMNNHTRFIQDEDEYKEYRDNYIKKKQMEEDAEENGQYYEAEPDKQFEEVFVDISALEKKKGKVYGLCVELIKESGREFKVYSRPFTYNTNENQWILSDIPEEESNSKYWTYGAIGAACLLAVGFCVYFFS